MLQTEQVKLVQTSIFQQLLFALKSAEFLNCLTFRLLTVFKGTAGLSAYLSPLLIFRLHNDIIAESFNNDISLLQGRYREQQRIKIAKRRRSRLSGDL